MEYSAVLLRRLRPYCARAHAEIMPNRWLLNQQILPVLSQQLLGWSEDAGAVQEFDPQQGVNA